jgi:hypothetical protein
MLCYRLGSKSMPEANAFVVPLRWLGVHHDDIERFNLPSTALQDLSAVDEAKAACLSRDPAVSADPVLAYEAACFLDDGSDGSHCSGVGSRQRVKMEIEGVLGRGMHFLASVYLPTKLNEAQSWFPEEYSSLDAGELSPRTVAGHSPAAISGVKRTAAELSAVHSLVHPL